MNIKDQLNNLSEKYTESFQKGGMIQELAAAMKKQGISIQYGFDGKPQYWKNGKILKGQEHGNAALLHSRTITQLKRGQTRKAIVSGSQSLPAQFVDPTGVSGWSDFNKTVVDAWDTSSKLDKGLATIGAIPGLAMLKKPFMAVKGASNIVKNAEKIIPNVKKMVTPVKKGKSPTLIPKPSTKKTVIPLYDVKDDPFLSKSAIEKEFIDDPYGTGVLTTNRQVDELMKKAQPEWQELYGNTFTNKDLGLFAKRKFADEIIESDKPLYKTSTSLTDPFLEQQGFNRNLTPDDKVLTESYTQGYDHLFNRRPSPTDEGYSRAFYEKDIIPSFENLITRNKLKNNTSVYRSMRDHVVAAERNGERMNIKMSDLQDGDIYTPNSFLSTSLHKQDDFGSLIYDIDLPQGQSYLVPNATNRNTYANESELVLPHKLKFRFESVKNADEAYDVKSLDELELNKEYPGGLMRTNEGIKMNNTLIPMEDAYRKERDILKNLKLPSSGKLVPINPYLTIPGAGILGAAQMSNDEEPQTYQQGGRLTGGEFMKGYAQSGGMVQKLASAMKKQGISIQYGFDGKPQYYKNGKILRGQDHGNAAMLASKTQQELSRGQVKDSMLGILNNPVVGVVDPTGVSNYPLAAKSLSKLVKPEEYKNIGYQDVVNVAGAVPLLGKVKTAGKILSTTKDLAKDILLNPKIKNKMSGVVSSGIVGGAGAGVVLAPFVDKYQDVKNLFTDEKEENSNMKKKTPPQYAAGGKIGLKDQLNTLAQRYNTM